MLPPIFCHALGRVSVCFDNRLPRRPMVRFGRPASPAKVLLHLGSRAAKRNVPYSGLPLPGRRRKDRPRQPIGCAGPACQTDPVFCLHFDLGFAGVYRLVAVQHRLHTVLQKVFGLHGGAAGVFFRRQDALQLLFRHPEHGVLPRCGRSGRSRRPPSFTWRAAAMECSRMPLVELLPVAAPLAPRPS